MGIVEINRSQCQISVHAFWSFPHAKPKEIACESHLNPSEKCSVYFSSHFHIANRKRNRSGTQYTLNISGMRRESHKYYENGAHMIWSSLLIHIECNNTFYTAHISLHFKSHKKKFISRVRHTFICFILFYFNSFHFLFWHYVLFTAVFLWFWVRSTSNGWTFEKFWSAQKF